eukprot:Awhi_evm1s3495
MPLIKVNNVDLFYEEYGSGDETIVFSHGYLMNHTMFAAQIDSLKDKYRVIAYDHRGHGGSETFCSEFGMYDLVEDCAALIDKLVGGPVHFMGMSTGGYIGVRLMVHRPELLRSVVLIDTSADSEPTMKLIQYKMMLMMIRLFGINSVYETTITILMGEKFRTDPSRKEEYQKWESYIKQDLNPTALYHFGHAIFSRDEIKDRLVGVELPTLVIVGEVDTPTPVETAQELKAVLSNASLAIIPNAGHTSPIEEPTAVTSAIESFLAGLN